MNGVSCCVVTSNSSAKLNGTIVIDTFIFLNNDTSYILYTICMQFYMMNELHAHIQLTYIYDAYVHAVHIQLTYIYDAYVHDVHIQLTYIYDAYVHAVHIQLTYIYDAYVHAVHIQLTYIYDAYVHAVHIPRSLLGHCVKRLPQSVMPSIHALRYIIHLASKRSF